MAIDSVERMRRRRRRQICWCSTSTCTCLLWRVFDVYTCEDIILGRGGRRKSAIANTNHLSSYVMSRSSSVRVSLLLLLYTQYIHIRTRIPLLAAVSGSGPGRLWAARVRCWFLSFSCACSICCLLSNSNLSARSADPVLMSEEDQEEDERRCFSSFPCGTIFGNLCVFSPRALPGAVWGSVGRPTFQHTLTVQELFLLV